jgi:hypothetical protein
MKIMAVIAGLDALKSSRQVQLFRDGRYVVNAFNDWTGKWKSFDWKKSMKAKEQVSNEEFPASRKPVKHHPAAEPLGSALARDGEDLSSSAAAGSRAPPPPGAGCLKRQALIHPVIATENLLAVETG